MRIELPWPDKRLTPNAKRRKHWRSYQPAINADREAARRLTFDAMQKHLATQAHFEGEHKLEMRIEFYPPDRRHRDDDGMIGAFKHMRDGVADALGVDDRRFRPHYFFEEPQKPGKVVVCLGDNFPAPSECSPSVLGKGRAGNGASTPPGPDHNHLVGGD